MKVILLHDVPKIGKKYDIKEVNDGYATNYLIPRKMAETATTKNVTRVNLIKETARMEKDIQTNLLYKNLHDIEGKEVHMKESANEQGNLFRSIHPKDIALALKAEHNIVLDEQYIVLDKPIKDVGEHDIVVDIQKKKAILKLVITAK